MKNFLHKIASALVICAAVLSFTACGDDTKPGEGPVTGTLTAETTALKFTSGTYSKVFEITTDGTVSAIQADVTYKGAETGWITTAVEDGDVLVTVAKNTGNARTADIVLSAKGAESISVAVSQKAVFSSEIIGKYTPQIDEENSSEDMKYGVFFLNYEWKDPANAPKLDLSFMNPEATEPMLLPYDLILPMAANLVGGLYYGGLDNFNFKDDGMIGAGYCELLDFMNMEFGPVTDFPNAETLEMLPVDAITYYTKDGKVYFAIDKEYLAYVGQAELGMNLIEIIDGLLVQYPGLGIESTDEYYAIPLKYELANGVLTLKVDKGMMMPYLPLIGALVPAFVPEEVEFELTPGSPLKIPAQELLGSMIDAIFNQTNSLEIGIGLTK